MTSKGQSLSEQSVRRTAEMTRRTLSVRDRTQRRRQPIAQQHAEVEGLLSLYIAEATDPITGATTGTMIPFQANPSGGVQTGGGQPITLTNRNPRVSGQASDFCRATWINGEWRPVLIRQTSGRVIQRFSSDSGLPLWSRDWYPRVEADSPLSITAANKIVTDGTSLYVGGTQISHNKSRKHAYTVAKYDEDGTQLWKADTGGAVSAMLSTSFGLVVAHADSYDVRDSITISCPTGGTMSDANGGPIVISASKSAVAVQANFDAVSFTAGKVIVAGTNIVSGLTFTFDASLGGPTFRRAIPRFSSESNPTTQATSNAANLTCLDPSDGTVLWTADIRPDPAYNVRPTVVELALKGSDFVAVVDDPQGDDITSYYKSYANIVVLDSSGSITDQFRINERVAAGGIVTDGTNFFVAVRNKLQLDKYDASHSLLWRKPSFVSSTDHISAPIAILGSSIITYEGGAYSPTNLSVFLQEISQASGDLLTSTFYDASMTGRDIAIHPDGRIAVSGAYYFGPSRVVIDRLPFDTTPLPYAPLEVLSDNSYPSALGVSTCPFFDGFATCGLRAIDAAWVNPRIQNFP